MSCSKLNDHGRSPLLVGRPRTGQEGIHRPFPLIVDLRLRETLPLGLNWMRGFTSWKHCIAEVAKNNNSLLSISVHPNPTIPTQRMKARSACYQVLQHLKILWVLYPKIQRHALSICWKARSKNWVVSDRQEVKGNSLIYLWIQTETSWPSCSCAAWINPHSGFRFQNDSCV